MADTFEGLGIAAGLATGAEDMQWERPSPLQADAVPVIRRGNNVVLFAGTGAGVTGAFGLGLLDRILASEDDDATLPRALVLVPDSAASSRTAAMLARLAAPAHLSVSALAQGWPTRPAHVLVASPEAARTEIGRSALKLDGLLTLVIAGVDRFDEERAWGETQAVLDAVPPGTQRVIATGAFPERIERFLEQHARKAMTVPPRPAGEGGPGGAVPTGTVRYAVAPGSDKLDALVGLLDALRADDEPPTEIAIIARTQERTAAVGEALTERGVRVEDFGGAGEGGFDATEGGVGAAGESTEPGAGAEGGDAGEAAGAAPAPPRVLALPFPEADQRSTRATVLSYDVPFDHDALAALHSAGGAVIVEPSEVQHLRMIAERANLRVEPVPVRAGPQPDAAERVREAIRSVMRDRDLSAYLALVEPLLDERPAAEVAAAAIYLARSAGVEAAGAGAGAGAAATHTAGGAAATRGAPARTTPSAGAAAGAPPPSTSYVRLFLSIGSRDGAGPGDILGSITGEAGVKGEEIGRIDIRESHSTVEVPTPLADTIIRALNGRTLRGRSVRIDYDRKDREAGPPGGRRPAGRSEGPGRGGPGRGGSSGGGPGRGGPGRGGPGRGGSRPGGRSGGGSPRGGAGSSSPRRGPPRGER